MPLSYWQVHDRLKRTRGRAADHTCKCGQPAQDWAFRGDPEKALVSTSGTGVGCTYSEDLTQYEPECRSCHLRADMTDEKRERSRANIPNTLAKVWSRPGPRGSTKTNQMQWTCLECGLTSTPGPMALHQKKLDHSGYTKELAA